MMQTRTFGRKPVTPTVSETEETRALDSFAERRDAAFTVIGDPDLADAAALREALGRLKKSPIGAALIDRAKAAGYRLCVDKTLGSLGAACPDDKIISIGGGLPADTMVGTLAHELRHAWQFEDGIRQHAGMHPDDVVLHVRSVEADAESVAAAACLELKRNGDGAALYGLYKTNQIVTRSLVDEAGDGPITARVIRAGYDAWFECDLVKSYDSQALELAEIQMERRPTRLSRMTESDMTRLGKMPDGSSYLQGSSHRSPLSESYLASSGIMNAMKQKGLARKYASLPAGLAERRPQTATVQSGRPSFGRRPVE